MPKFRSFVALHAKIRVKRVIDLFDFVESVSSEIARKGMVMIRIYRQS